MSVLERVEKSGVRDFLGRGWLTHDGMWFYNTYNELGIEAANKLNLAAIRSLAPIELMGARKLLGLDKKEITSFDELAGFLKDCLELILPASLFGKMSIYVSERNIFRWEWKQGECFAYKGMLQAGLVDEYRCGVMFRIECWLKALNIKYEISPVIDKCIMHEKGMCRGEIKVSMDS
ncbi:MAG TPA: hypothetical protein VIS94_09795 [Desulfomonilia bacterium]